jgi:4-amino-4-deoxy-L-arabinose transferase-like glycosyltransferase
MTKIKNENLFCFFILGLLFFDLGNVDAIRQGTEGFYLLISKEMFQKGSYLTPIIYDAPHWSKPPLHFWLPMPLYKVFGESFLLLGRLSILLLSLICSFLISLWYEKELKRNWIEAFFFLVTPLYFIKYSRIFMMEMPLTYLSVLGSLYFYTYLKDKTRKSLFIAVLFSGLSVLIKGPVSLLMIFPSAFIYSLLQKRNSFNRFFVFSLLTTLLGSLWFVLSIAKYGESFIDYFFIRENLGKFTAKSYPLRSVFQGLIIYSFPVNIFSIYLLKNRKTLNFNKTTQYLLLSFIFYFILWLLPKQKSHHYAVPSIPFLCILLSYYFFSLKKEVRLNALKTYRSINHFIIFFCLLIGSLLFYFKDFLSLSENSTYLSGSFACLGLWGYLQKRPINRAFLLSFLIPFILLWQFILPLAFLPIVPSKVASVLQKETQSRFFVSHRKPFFIFEAADKKGLIISAEVLSDPRINYGDFVFGSGPPFNNTNANEGYRIVETWYSWKRGVGFSQALDALKQKDLRLIQTKYFLLRKNVAK